MSTKVFLVAFVIFVGCSCSSQDVSYESLKVAASRGKSFKTPELKYPPDVNFPRGASAAPKTPHTNKKSQGKTKMSGLKKPRSYSRRDSLSPEEDQLRPQQQETSRPAEVLLGKDVPPELGQHVRLSKTTLQERPYLPDKGAGAFRPLCSSLHVDGCFRKDHSCAEGRDELHGAI
eukprot:491551-Hanusia_phi.AAC.1